MITAQDLLDAGWCEGPEIGQALDRARQYQERGINDPKYLLKLLARDVPKAKTKLTARDQPAPLGEAIAATCEEDEVNIGNVRRLMDQLLRMPRITRGALMPDACPAGNAPAAIPVGGAIAVENAIMPSAHSADICCSMHATFFRCGIALSEMLDDLVASTRFGFGGRKPDDLVHHPVVDEEVWGNRFLSGLDQHARIHIADQGDGNHFAFIGKVEFSGTAIAQLEAGGHSALAAALRAASVDGERFESLALVTHHGSRGLGAQVYKRGQNAAIKHTMKIAEAIPKAAVWLDYDTPEGEAYWEALQYVARWTKANHESIHARFLERTGTSEIASFGNEHNFVWKRGDIFMHGKGATPAWRDGGGSPLLGLIPLNMAAPILITLGADNEDYLSFCPHGAGRNRSRRATLRQFPDPQDARAALAESTRGIEARWFFGKPDLSESPLGYKPADQVRAQIAEFGLADVIAEIAPLGSLMAGDSGTPAWIRRKQEDLTPKQRRQIQHRAERRKNRQRMKGRDWEDE